MLQIQPNQSPAQAPSLQTTRNGISQNWTDIDRVFKINHGEINILPNEGKHTFVEMPIQAVAPVPLAGEVGLYSFAGFFSGQAALYFTGVNPDTTIYNYNISQSTNSGSHWWAQLPSGVIMKWGQIGAALGSTTINFNADPNVPVFTFPPFPQISGSVSPLLITAITTTGFTVNNTSGVVGQMYYFAIGK